QNGLPPPQSLIRAQTCTQLPAHHHMRLKQTYEVLGCERRPSVRCGDQRHENHHMPQDLREPATELEHQPACVLNPTTRRRGNRTHQHTPRRKKKRRGHRRRSSSAAQHTPTPNPSPRRCTYRKGADWRSGSKARKPRLEGELSGRRYAPPRAVRTGGNEIYFFCLQEIRSGKERRESQLNMD
ncbi:hypothetical protein HID58_043680, partial [Brassica napus]